MWKDKFLLIFGCLLHAHSAISWTCSQHTDCSSTEGALCLGTTCSCPAGQEMVFGGTVCIDRSPYYTWPCVEDHQCSGLVTNFECRVTGESNEGNCFCRNGFHYQGGRCWQSAGYESPCNRDEDCMGALQDPFSLACVSGLCGCAPGYYRRQRGECRKIAYAVGDGCVLDEDCQFENGACDINAFSCYDRTLTKEAEPHENTQSSQQGSVLHQLHAAVTSIRNGANASQNGVLTRQHGVACDATNVCNEPFVCANFGACVCPLGYYPNEDGTMCYAELGFPSTPEQCIGFLAEVIDGICTCKPNFYYEENMRDCVKVARTISDACVNDNNCRTFGVSARCGTPTEPLFLRTCECIPEQAVWDEERSMCRLFVGIGESCQENSDCLAGSLEIDCVVGATGEGVCTCPPDRTEHEGLCLTSGLELGNECQHSLECTATENTGCYEGLCACTDGYQESEGFCAPTIGGNCRDDSDCIIDNMVCVIDDLTNNATCQCDHGFAPDGDQCWPHVLDNQSPCNVSAQCTATMGENAACIDSLCVCVNEHHYRDGGCWPQIGLFQGCGRTSECYLGDISERVECRNSICQCSFDYPYSEQLQTCISGATTTMGSLLTIVAALYYVLSQ